MRILIAGVNGNIGSELFSRLEMQVPTESISYHESPIKKDFTKIDLTDVSKVEEFAKNCNIFDVLVFLVGLAHSKGKGKDLKKFKKVNSGTLINLLSALEENNKRVKKIIFASTIAVYGEKYQQKIYSEESVQEPSSPYAISKLEAEKYLRDNYKSESWILRLSPVYSSDIKLNIIRRTKIGHLFYRIGDGSKKLSLCNLENIGIVVENIMYDKLPAGVYNLSDAKEYTYNQLLQSQQAKWALYIPVFFIEIIYKLGKMFNNIFLKENSIKLITDNIFPSTKIRSYIDIPFTIDDVQFDHC